MLAILDKDTRLGRERKGQGKGRAILEDIQSVVDEEGGGNNHYREQR